VKLTARCVACGKLLGTVDDDGWLWCSTPARLVNRRRLVATLDVGDDGVAHASPSDDFRMRMIQRDKYVANPQCLVWEYPYVCNLDACMDALGTEWTVPPPSDAEPPFKVMPEGRVLS
jgi:hypothetical protein